MDEQAKKVIESLPESLTNQLLRKVSNVVEQSGMFFRAFARRKSLASTEKKFASKGYNKSKKMQDLFGVRIALYFKDDVPICEELIKKKFIVADHSIDPLDKEVFKPVRINYVCKLPEEIKSEISENFWESSFIDDTFEIQIRTVFSEGWHEIEHDMRYKCKNEWISEDDMSRALNGIFATLETCDWSIISLFDQMAYKKYKTHEWESMLRNKLRLRVNDGQLSNSIVILLNQKPQIAKELLKINRSDMITHLTEDPLSRIPKTLDNLVYIMNLLYIQDEQINNMVPSILMSLFNRMNKYNHP